MVSAAHRRSRDSLRSASYAYRTREEAATLARLLAGVVPVGKMTELGLGELMLNAVEHGNLELGWARKSELLHAGRLDEEIERRLVTPPWRDRVARVDVTRGPREATFVISDEGPGFSWRDLVEAMPAGPGEPNGRGIALARTLCFHELSYNTAGNVVTARIRW